MKIYSNYILAILIAFCMSNCNNSVKVNSYEDGDLRFSLRKGVCFGKCPVYELKIYQSRYTTYTGEQNTDKLGQYNKMILKEDFKKLEKAFEALNFELYPDQFKSNVADLPTIEIGYHNGKEFRVISGKEDRPEDLMQVQFLLEKIADNKDWTFLKGLDELYKDKKPEPSYIYNEIIIEPKKGLLLTKWLDSNSKYGVRLVKKIAPALDYYLIEYDTKKVDPKVFLEMVQKDSNIKSAEFNKKTTLRN